MRHKSVLSVLLCAVFGVCSICSRVAGQVATQIPNPTDPTITDVQLRSLTADTTATFLLAIVGDNLGDDQNRPKVWITTKNDPARHAVEDKDVLLVTPKEVIVEDTLPVGSEITTVSVEVRRKSASSKGFTVSIKSNPPPPSLKEFQVKFDHQKNKEYPNLHSLLVTKESGEGGFDTNPNHMRVDLEPTGATDLNVMQSNEQQLELHFVAAADYEPQNVVVTVYDNGDLDHRCPVAVSKKASADDPNQPKITDIQTVFLMRSQGIGRVRIYGKGFGDQYSGPPYSVDDYLQNCLERPWLLGTDRNDPATKTREDDEKERRDRECTRLVGNAQKAWKEWQDGVRAKVRVGVNSRDEDIRVEKAEIIDINDAMIDVYFEFSRYRGYSWPFRLAGINITIQKTIQKTKQTVKAEKVTGIVVGPTPVTYSLAKDIGPKRDSNLTYKYTVLAKKSANVLLGRGISDNFYVLQLSVVNNGAKKVAVPLAGIQAEVEWMRGRSPNAKYEYVEGPPTLAPIPLAAVSAYFAAYEKNKGARATLFNVFDGLTTLGAALLPFTGPSLKDAQVVFTGGFIPGLRKVIGDLSGQQLQNLTALSWETTGTISPSGGSMEKLIYVQRKEQFADKPARLVAVSKQTRKQISNILDLEINGYDIPESEAKTATPITTQPAATPAPKTETLTPPTTP